MSLKITKAKEFNFDNLENYQTKTWTYNPTVETITSDNDEPVNLEELSQADVTDMYNIYSELYKSNIFEITPLTYNLNRMNVTDDMGNIIAVVYADNDGNIRKIVTKTNSGDVELTYDSRNRLIKYECGDVKVSYDYTPSYFEKKQFYDLYGADKSTSVNFVATATINGHDIKYYSVGKQENDNAVQVPIISSQLYENFSDKTLSLIEDNFSGFVIGPWSTSSNPELGGSAGAYFLGGENDFIFVPSADTYDTSYHYGVYLHEMGHAIQYLNGLDQSPKIERLYEKYKDELIEIKRYHEDIGEDASYDNQAEFFADAVARYYDSPDVFERICPELYEEMSKILN